MSTPESRFCLANLISLMVSYDHEAELARIRLAREDNLDLFHYYRKIDRSKNGFISKTDFAIFLNSHGIFPPGKAMDKFFRKGRDNVLKITYNDFINQILPVLEPELKKQCLAKSGDTYTEYSASIEKSMESMIATIYSKESELALQIQEALNSASKSFDIDDYVFTLCDPLTGFFDFMKIQELMNENGFDFDQQRFDYLVNRLCINTVNRISPSDLLKYFFPERFLPSKPPVPQEDIHRFKFATKPFTITQRPASASKPNSIYEASPLNLEGQSAIFATQPRKSTQQSNLEKFASPVRPIDFPDLTNLPPNDTSAPNSQRNSAMKSQATAVKESFYREDRSFASPNNKVMSAAKLSNMNILNEDLNTGKFPGNPIEELGPDDYKTKYLHQKPFEKSRITAASLEAQNTSLNVQKEIEKPPSDPYGERIASKFLASNMKSIPSYIKSTPDAEHLHANRNETFGITDNPDLIARLNANVQPHPQSQSGANYSLSGRTTTTATLQNKYSNLNAPTSYLQTQEPSSSYDYRQGFYTTAANVQTVNTNFSPILQAPLKYTQPLRESTLQTSSAYGQTYSNEINKPTLSLQASSYNAPARFYSPKYTRANPLQTSQPISNENISKYTYGIEQKDYPSKYTAPLSSQVQSGSALQSSLTGINRSQYETPYGKGGLGQSQNLQSSAQGWKEKIEMSRKVKGESTYKFGNDAYGKMWNPVDEQ